MKLDLSKTIAPKSDQLNSDDLIGGPLTIRVTEVKVVAEDQPVWIHFAGDCGKPYKPCKSMRRVLVKAWGPDGAKYVGRSMTLYLDDQVRYGGAAVGGIRISHLSDIGQSITIALTVKRATKKAYTVRSIDVAQDAYLDAAVEGGSETVSLGIVLRAIEDASNADDLSEVAKVATKLSESDRIAAREAYVVKAEMLKAKTDCARVGP